MKPPRSAQPLPRYVQRKPLKSGWAYFFNVPTWARKAGCPVKNEALGGLRSRRRACRDRAVARIR